MRNFYASWQIGFRMLRAAYALGVQVIVSKVFTRQVRSSAFSEAFIV